MDVQSVQIAGPKEDVLCLVLEYPGRLSTEANGRLRQEINPLEERLGVPIIVLADGLKARVMRKSDADVLDAIAEASAVLREIRDSLRLKQ